MSGGDSVAISYETLRDNIAPAFVRHINCFSSPLLYKGNHRGTALFATYHGVYGFITAHHSIHYPPKLNLCDSDDQTLQFKVKETPHRFGFALNTLVEIPIGCPSADCGYSEDGPDLTFVVLPKGESLSTLMSFKSFYNLENTIARAELSGSSEFCIISGFPDVLKQTEVSAGIRETSFKELFMIGRFESHSYSCKNGFDYMTVNVLAEPNTEKPKDFGGMSGGGVWSFSIVWNSDNQSFKVMDPVLAGITFYQKTKNTERVALVFHCGKSIERVKEKISAWV